MRKSEATADTPVARLMQLNESACDIFKRRGHDLQSEPLEISICHQHCNGGLVGSIWWESNIKNLFPVGECNGSHGIYRPGGSALNSGQVGSLRAAEYIAHHRRKKIKNSSDPFSLELESAVKNQA